MVQDVFEFLELLGFFFQFVYLAFVAIYGLIPILYNLRLILNLLLQNLIGLLQPLNFPPIFPLLINLRFPLLLLLLNLLIRNRNITVRPKGSLRYVLLLLGVIIGNFLNLFLFLFVDLFYCFVVFALEAFDVF